MSEQTSLLSRKVDELAPTRALMKAEGVKGFERPTRAVWRIGRGIKDRDGERIRPSGWEVSDPLPMVLLVHDGRKIPIGAIEKFTPDDGGPLLDIVFNDDVENFTDAQITADLVRLGRWPFGSVGFDPYEWENADGKRETREKGEPFPFPSPGREYIRQELLEQSIVPVPSDVSNLAQSVKAFMGGTSTMTNDTTYITDGGDWGGSTVVPGSGDISSSYKFTIYGPPVLDTSPLEDWERAALALFAKDFERYEWRYRFGLKLAEAQDQAAADEVIDAAHKIAALLRGTSATRAE